MNKIVIMGASGHASVVLDIFQSSKEYLVIGFLDPQREMGSEFLGLPVLGAEAELKDLLDRYPGLCAALGVGDNGLRERIVAQVQGVCPSIGFPAVIHPSAVISPLSKIGKGTVIMASSVVNPNVEIGDFCVLNTRSSIDHDSKMGNYSSLGPGVITGGNCNIGCSSAIGIGAVLLQSVSIGDHTVVGAASLVLNSIPANVVAYGSPAKIVCARNPGDMYLR